MQNIPLITPQYWRNYELLDSGNGKKLERFGQYILSRPEPQALWQPSLSEQDWLNEADAMFERNEEKDKDKKNEKNQSEKNQTDKGDWYIKTPETQNGWTLRYQSDLLDLKFKISLSAFKHVGIFPEQASNWEFIAESLKNLQPYRQTPNILNLFAYTGGASLAARQFGADVTHVDSIKSVLSWANENMALSNLTDIRWMAEDALTFVRREVRRGKTYQGIILDPPAYGRGTNNEKWVLEEYIYEMLSLCKEILDKRDGFLVLNLYSLGFSPLIVENLLAQIFPNKNLEIGELYLEDGFKKKLPLGIYGRF